MDSVEFQPVQRDFRDKIMEQIRHRGTKIFNSKSKSVRVPLSLISLVKAEVSLSVAADNSVCNMAWNLSIRAESWAASASALGERGRLSSEDESNTLGKPAKAPASSSRPHVSAILGPHSSVLEVCLEDLEFLCCHIPSTKWSGRSPEFRLRCLSKIRMLLITRNR